MTAIILMSLTGIVLILPVAIKALRRLRAFWRGRRASNKKTRDHQWLSPFSEEEDDPSQLERHGLGEPLLVVERPREGD